VKTSKVGFIDSGLGGLTIMAPVMAAYPWIDTFYLADQAYAPYGTKRGEVVGKRLDLAVGYLASLGADVIVVACNTASTMLPGKNYPVPVLGIIAPIIKEIEALDPNRVLVLATELTTRSGIYQDALSRHGIEGDVVHVQSLVDHVEHGAHSDPDSIGVVRKTLNKKPFKRDGYDVVVLGCTHFGWIKDDLSDIFSEAVVVSGAGEVIRMLERFVGLKVDRMGSVMLLSTGDPADLEQAALSFDRRSVSIRAVSIESGHPSGESDKEDIK
jgi:glutamate racemase